MKKNIIYSILAVLLLAFTAIMFFYPDAIRGNVLMQADIQQGLANGHEGQVYHETTGNTTRWTNALFGGMPNFQISPSYPSSGLLSWISTIYTLGLPSPANLLFAMMLGFFIMCLCFRMKWHYALLGAAAWGFSSYFIIIIGAGHIWKFVTLSYIPPTIGGIVLLYRGRYLSGTALSALFGALQLQANHPQMSYYFFFVIFFLVMAWLYKAIKEKRLKEWGIASGCMVAAGVLALLANSSSLYNTYEYSKETVRGRATELSVPSSATKNAETPKEGLAHADITAWSYGYSETFSLLVPNVKGGATIKPVAGENRILGMNETPRAEELYESGNLSPEEFQFMGQFPQYFGDQPMTNGPVYVGAFILLLAILALIIVEGPLKWALFGVSILSILLAWGHNLEGVTNFFIDHFPGYNKFRAVASILVIVEFTIPILALMCLKKIAATPDFLKRYQWQFIGVFGSGAVICLLGWLSPSIFGSPFSISETEQLSEMGLFSIPEYSNVLYAVRDARLSLVSADSLRSLVFIAAGVAMIWIYCKGIVKRQSVFILSITALTLIDLYTVGKRYVDTENFTEPAPVENTFAMTEADREILKDQSNYRVLDLDNFNGARSSYFHKTIGGYHAAKLTRYNDLMSRQITGSRMNPAVVNMLNARYVIHDNQSSFNPDACGNAWFVDKISYVNSPDEEMNALDNFDPLATAVADKRFTSILGEGTVKTPGDTIIETSYAPDRLTYTSRSAKGGTAVFSEIYFPWGWKATIDGNEAPIGRVNYVLRALRIPAGDHEIVFEFNPRSIRVTEGLSIGSIIIIYIICAAALAGIFLEIKRRRHQPMPRKEVE